MIDKMDEIKFAACPFCGSTDIQATGYQRKTSDGRFNVAMVYCRVCKALGPEVQDKNPEQATRRAIEKWNCRQGND